MGIWEVTLSKKSHNSFNLRHSRKHRNCHSPTHTTILQPYLSHGIKAQTMNQLFHLPGLVCGGIFDDIVVYSGMLEEHVEHLTSYLLDIT